MPKQHSLGNKQTRRPSHATPKREGRRTNSARHVTPGPADGLAELPSTVKSLERPARGGSPASQGTQPPATASGKPEAKPEATTSKEPR